MKKLVAIISVLGLFAVSAQASNSWDIRITNEGFRNALAPRHNDAESGVEALGMAVISGLVLYIQKSTEEAQIKDHAGQIANEVNTRLAALAEQNADSAQVLQSIVKQHEKLVEFFNQRRKISKEELRQRMAVLFDTIKRLPNQELAKQVKAALNHAYYFPSATTGRTFSLKQILHIVFEDDRYRLFSFFG